MNGPLSDKGKRTALASLIGIGFYLIPQIIYVISAAILAKSSGSINADEYVMSNTALGYMQFIVSIPIVCYGIFAFRDDFKKGLKSLKEVKTWGIIFGAFILCLMLTFGVGIIYQMFGITGSSDNQSTVEAMLLSDAAIPMAIAVVVLAPIGEELIFRKMIFGVCEDSLGLKPIVPILISTIVFAFIHVISGDSLIFIFQYIPLALMMVLAYYYSERNIVASIGVHALNNLFSLIMLYLSIWLNI